MAASPDEYALVIAAKKFGAVLKVRLIIFFTLQGILTGFGWM